MSVDPGALAAELAAVIGSGEADPPDDVADALLPLVEAYTEARIAAALTAAADEMREAQIPRYGYADPYVQGLHDAFEMAETSLRARAASPTASDAIQQSPAGNAPTEPAPDLGLAPVGASPAAPVHAPQPPAGPPADHVHGFVYDEFGAGEFCGFGPPSNRCNRRNHESPHEQREAQPPAEEDP